MAGEARLVELDEVDPGGDEGLELGVDDRDEGLGDRVAIGVDVAAVDAAGQRERPGDRHLDRRVGEFAEPAIFGDGPQPVGCRQGRDASISVALIVGRQRPIAGPGERLQTAQVFVEPQVEIDPLHLAVGDPVEPGAELVVDGQPDGVAHGLLAVGRPEPLGIGSRRRRISRTSRGTTSFRSPWPGIKVLVLHEIDPRDRTGTPRRQGTAS